LFHNSLFRCSFRSRYSSPLLFSIFRSRAALELENLALRHQIGILRGESWRYQELLNKEERRCSGGPSFVVPATLDSNTSCGLVPKGKAPPFNKLRAGFLRQKARQKWGTQSPG